MFWMTRFPDVLHCFDDPVVETTVAGHQRKLPCSLGFDACAIELSTHHFEESDQKVEFNCSQPLHLPQ